LGVVLLAGARSVGRCPACGEVLEVRRLQCPSCATAVEGRFAPSPYAALAPEQAAFLETFLRARGNLREVERVLGLSYPTVRGRLDAVLETLGYGGGEGPAGFTDAEPEAPGGAAAGGAAASAPAAGDPMRRATLEALQRGEITAAEAVRRIRKD
jgi:hypothetical protein